MLDNTTNKPKGGERVFLRIPAKLKAAIFIDNRPYKKVIINDLSTIGLSFYAQEDVKIPDSFEIRLRFPGHIKPIKTKVEARNQNNKNGMIRIGCQFVDLPKKDAYAISEYITHFIEFSLPCRLLGMAGFLLFVDALCRLFVYMINIYFIEVTATRNAAASRSLHLYGIILLLYAAGSFIVCVYSDNIKNKKFLINMCLGAGVFLFLSVKYINMYRLHTWNSDFLIGMVYFGFESFLIGYAGLALVLFTASIKKMVFIADSIESYVGSFKRDKAASIEA